MKTSDLDYHLPSERIAQKPLSVRDASRLLLLSRKTGRLEDRQFRELPELLQEGDCLVFNDTRVFPARLIGRKASGGRAEFLLLRRLGEGACQEAAGESRQPACEVWESLVKPNRLEPGSRVIFVPNRLEGVVQDRLDGGKRKIVLLHPAKDRRLTKKLLDETGQVPLPPYIKEPLTDQERYQTIYGRREASAAAPTAGLHFSERVLGSLGNNGIHLCYLSLEIGLDTFQPVREEEIEDHFIHRERFEIGAQAADIINQVRSAGGRIVAVGTSSVRALETVAKKSIPVGATQGYTDLAIYPGHRFLLTDAMITNFHLPRTSLLALVSAFAGREAILRSYQEAVGKGYRFLSFGDAMIIL